MTNKTFPCPKSGQLLQFKRGKVEILYLSQLLPAFVVSPPVVFVKSEVKPVFPDVKSPFVTKLEPKELAVALKSIGPPLQEGLLLLAVILKLGVLSVIVTTLEGVQAPAPERTKRTK